MPERALMLKLSAAIAIKLALLAGLWFFFVKDYRVHIDTSGMADHLNIQVNEGNHHG